MFRSGWVVRLGVLAASLAMLVASGCESGGKRGDGADDGSVRDQQSASMADSDAERASQRMHENAEG